jgi:hypothetical protein
MQYDDPSAHLPARHRFEQQSPPTAHVFPAVLQAVVSGAHLPAAQLPLQQLAFVVHATLSEMQAAAPHLPDTQLRPQHSVGEPQVAPAGAQAVRLDAHVLVAASHSCEQQSAPV